MKNLKVIALVLCVGIVFAAIASVGLAMWLSSVSAAVPAGSAPPSYRRSRPGPDCRCLP